MIEINKTYLSDTNTEPGQAKKYIVVHETDNYRRGAGAEAHAEAQYQGNLSTSVHFYVDDHAVYQAAALSRAVWAIGIDYGKRTVPDATNYNSINIEICVNPDSDYQTARANAIELVKYLIAVTGIPAERVIRHYDAKGKYCPRKMMDDPSLWTDLKEKVGEAAGEEGSREVNVEYQVYAGGRWLPLVKNLEDYAGLEGKPVKGLAVRVDRGRIKYRVHTALGWFDWIWGENFDPDNIKTGFAGDLAREIDAVQVYYYTPDDIRPYRKILYRVDTVNRSAYFAWQSDTDTDNGQDGYAGKIGEAIDRIQMIIR
jgi:N-acetyl-anhydromuramyl-L-alanine amidase AmpD